MVEDPNEIYYIGVCSECKSDQPASYMERTKFDEPPCKFCGGVVAIIRYTTEQGRKDFLDRRDSERGLGTAYTEGDRGE